MSGTLIVVAPSSSAIWSTSAVNSRSARVASIGENSTSSQYSRACATAARQQWGSRGIWIPETTHFSGPDVLPDDIAAEMQDLYLLRKPWAQRSERFQRYTETVQSAEPYPVFIKKPRVKVVYIDKDHLHLNVGPNPDMQREMLVEMTKY